MTRGTCAAEQPSIALLLVEIAENSTAGSINRNFCQPERWVGFLWHGCTEYNTLKRGTKLTHAAFAVATFVCGCFLFHEPPRECTSNDMEEEKGQEEDEEETED